MDNLITTFETDLNIRMGNAIINEIFEASKVFEEYQKKLREAVFNRLVEEGIVDHDGNLKSDSEM